MSVGMLLLTIAAVLVFCGLLQRVLDRMYLTDRQALLVIALMLIGSWLPDISIGIVKINLGGAVIPLCVCGYLLVKANEPRERWRSVFGGILTGVSIHILSRLLPSEAETLPLDPIWLYGICGGVIAWVLGRSRRAAFICGISGVIIADIISAVVTSMQGYQTQLNLGGAGIGDAAVISGVAAVLLCELIGESVERLIRRQVAREGNRS